MSIATPNRNLQHARIEVLCICQELIESYFNWQTKEEVPGGWVHVQTGTIACRQPSWKVMIEARPEVRDDNEDTMEIPEDQFPTALTARV